MMLSASEQCVLQFFREFLVTPGQMLCFHGPDLEKHRAGLQQLTDKELLVKERFKGGYSLTDAGFAAMKDGA
jgi:hypothetical protein